jgi:hypothetical protein
LTPQLLLGMLKRPTSEQSVKSSDLSLCKCDPKMKSPLGLGFSDRGLSAVRGENGQPISAANDVARLLAALLRKIKLHPGV